MQGRGPETPRGSVPADATEAASVTKHNDINKQALSFAHR
jgi:hypothetical protein